MFGDARMTDVDVLEAVPSRRSSTPHLARLLRRAFDEEPVQRWLFPQATARAVASELWFRGMLAAAYAEGEVWQIGRRAVAVWFDSERPLPAKTINDYAYQALLRLMPHTASVKSAMDAELEKRRPIGRHRYLAAVATAPEARGHGLGRMVLAPVLNSREGVDCYLETSEPRSLRFYQSLGFGIVDELSVADSPPIWCMHRMHARR